MRGSPGFSDRVFAAITIGLILGLFTTVLLCQ